MTPTLSAPDLATACRELAVRARDASRLLATAGSAAKDRWLRRVADALSSRQEGIFEANARDVSAAREHGLTGAQIDRLKLTPERLRAAASGLLEVVALPD